MAAQKKSISKPRKLSAQKAKQLARSLQRATALLESQSKPAKPLSLRSTATGQGRVVFRASRVLSSLARTAKS